MQIKSKEDILFIYYVKFPPAIIANQKGKDGNITYDGYAMDAVKLMSDYFNIT